MKCPNDQTTLLISERQGIEIDYCPDCRGVWLDRGELDKLIEKNSASYSTPTRSQTSDSHGTHDSHYRQEYNTHHDSSYKHSPHKKRRESFLGDIFDF